MTNLINNFVNYLYLKERSREQSHVSEINSERYLPKLSRKELNKKSRLKNFYF